MSDRDTPDGPLAGGDGPDEVGGRRWPPWLVPVIASLIGGFFILLNGWFAYIASSSKDVMEARNETLTRQLDDMKERIDRLDDRVIFLEQNRAPPSGQ